MANSTAITATSTATTAAEASNNNTTTTQVLSSLHHDYIHMVAFDVYGRRMATCSGDRLVRIWDLTDTGAWILGASWQAHRGAVTGVAWAHPEYGSVVASCGADGDVKIWEERGTSSTSSVIANNPSSQQQQQQQQQVRWNLKASLTEARRSVTCVQFAPRHLGLKLAVGGADGCVRVYEAVDIMNLTQWPLAATLQSFSEGTKLGCTGLSWCTGRFEPPTLVASGSHLVIYRYS
jgi:nucleoporin SEH1